MNLWMVRPFGAQISKAQDLDQDSECVTRCDKASKSSEYCALLGVFVCGCLCFVRSFCLTKWLMQPREWQVKSPIRDLFEKSNPY